MLSPFSVGQMPAIAGRSIFEFGHRHQGAGIAGGDRDIRLVLRHRVDRLPHGGLAAAAAQRLARLLVHGDGHVAMMERAGGLQLRILRKQRLALGGNAEKHEADIGMALESLGCARDSDLRTEVATHDVDGNSDHACLALLLVPTEESHRG
jgi:hypothetical protein